MSRALRTVIVLALCCGIAAAAPLALAGSGPATTPTSTAVQTTSVQPKFTMDDIEKQLMCPTCGTRLDLSHSDAANAIRVRVDQWRLQGLSEQQVKDRLVADLGPSVLAEPSTSGFAGFAWWIPALVAVLGVLAAIAALLFWRRSAEPAPAPAVPDPGVDAELEQRIDDELKRFDG